MAKLPKYTKEKMKGNTGESLAQFILSKFSLVHAIDGSNDVGNDFICELIKDQYPTNLLFYIQVKYMNTEPVIRRETLEYWKGSPIPVYLFWIKDRFPLNPYPIERLEDAEIWYKRYTPVLHNQKRHKNEEFKTFGEIDFKRDLIVDYARTQYVKGFTPIIEPRAFLALDEKFQTDLPRYALFIKDVVPEYASKILNKSWTTFFVTASLLSQKEKLGDLENAFKSVDLAYRLYSESTDARKLPDIKFVLEKLKEDINSKLRVVKMRDQLDKK